MIDQILNLYMTHPALFHITWGVVSAIILAIFKPRTPEQYEALSKDYPRFARVLKFISAVGVDPVKILEVFKK